MRTGPLVAFLCISATLYLAWGQIAAYRERERIQTANAAERRTRMAELSADGCNGAVASLAAMEHRVLKAGGIEVPEALASDITLCLEENIMSGPSRLQMERTHLIRLFPRETSALPNE
ncbi:hypothetical protein [Rhizobium sullae]|uniref:Uncharacterized protein n=1 Tax=Rhizobium sullae TaxID=50338 RepID=A0A2N0D2P8_RHISU|nr:hypothetical protein [Rhizobium sullae]PKA40318.1 hypothetical protein CWR43_27390 [Rhizobium sullae]UWU15123.1 hypothetical protein N2599_03635 [Rhizobium sullae]